jgi:hypothetical protein
MDFRPTGTRRDPRRRKSCLTDAQIVAIPEYDAGASPAELAPRHSVHTNTIRCLGHPSAASRMVLIVPGFRSPPVHRQYCASRAECEDAVRTALSQFDETGAHQSPLIAFAVTVGNRPLRV